MDTKKCLAGVFSIVKFGVKKFHILTRIKQFNNLRRKSINDPKNKIVLNLFSY